MRQSIEIESHEFSGWFAGYHARDAEIEQLRAQLEAARKCETCGTPLSRECPNCQRLWES
jgi:hypothetical protein